MELKHQLEMRGAFMESKQEFLPELWNASNWICGPLSDAQPQLGTTCGVCYLQGCVRDVAKLSVGILNYHYIRMWLELNGAATKQNP